MVTIMVAINKVVSVEINKVDLEETNRVVDLVEMVIKEEEASAHLLPQLLQVLQLQHQVVLSVMASII